MNNKQPLGHKLWFKVFLTILLFLPAFTIHSYDPTKTSEVISAVLAQPWIMSIPWLLPLAKLALLGIMLLPLIKGKSQNKIILTYYAFMLIPLAIFQNMTRTDEFGFTWLIGNTLAQLTIAVYCFYVLLKRWEEKDKGCQVNRLWIIPLISMAFLFPYIVGVDGIPRPGFSVMVFTNEAGLTYCMVTPIILGMLVLSKKALYAPLVSSISYLGLLYGIMNMVTWFILQPQGWWMGVLHLPLLIISFYCLLKSRSARRTEGAGQARYGCQP